MDGWEAAFLTLLIAIVIGALGFVSYSNVNTTGIFSLLKVFFFAITNFIPFRINYFWSYLADLIGQELRYTIGSVIGFLAIVLNWLLAKLLPDGDVDANLPEARNVMDDGV
jgi:hypothetical protein